MSRASRKSFSFPKSERLRRRSEFRAVFAGGRRFETEHFVILMRPNEQETVRLGIVCSKRVGNAVVRNRVKRLIREFFRLNKHRFPGATDVVIVAKPGCAKMDYWSVTQEISERLP